MLRLCKNCLTFYSISMQAVRLLVEIRSNKLDNIPFYLVDLMRDAFLTVLTQNHMTVTAILPVKTAGVTLPRNT